jgi:hypothetical protein
VGRKFDACYLFVDDVENIVKNAKTDLRQFAAQLGGALFRDDVYSNTAGFLSVFLTTHAQAAQMLAKEWRECGYQTRAELHTQSENSVMITRLTSIGAEKVIAEYLQFFRSEAIDDPLFSFNKEAVHALAEKSQYHPAQLLRNCRKVLLQAVDDGIDNITKEFAMTVLESSVDALPTAGGPEAGSSFGGYFAATQHVCRFRSEADMNRQARSATSVANDPLRKSSTYQARAATWPLSLALMKREASGRGQPAGGDGASP